MKKIFLLFIIIIPLSFVCCKVNSSDENTNNSTKTNSVTEGNSTDSNEIIFYKVEMNIDYSAYQRTHTVTEYHCKDLGDSYYEVITYKIHYFAASTGGHGSTHYNNGAYKYSAEGQLVDIVRQGNVTPNSIEKYMTNKTITRTVTDYVTQASVVLYIPTKIKSDQCYYGITKK